MHKDPLSQIISSSETLSIGKSSEESKTEPNACMNGEGISGLSKTPEKSSCGVGFVVDRKGAASHEILMTALNALACVEHRGACGSDGITSDGAGIMADIPFDLFGYTKGSIAIAALFVPPEPSRKQLALSIFEETFSFMGLTVLEYREVPINVDVLGSDAKRNLPAIVHAIIARPKYCRTDESFNKLLYAAKQRTRTKEKDKGIISQFFFTSLSTTTIVYKGLTRAETLADFYLDLRNPSFKTRFALFHRRFSTNTKTSWDKAQPFRLISHNGEINTIASNRAWSYSREQSLGLPIDELLTHQGISDSGSLNEMVEALKYRSSIPRVEDILAIMIPPATQNNAFYKFWGRAMEPWDGPALITYSDGETIGARLDRNGFRPCRWAMTDDAFYLCSEAGSFSLDEARVTRKGALHAGSGVSINLESGEIHFEDPSLSRENFGAHFDARLSRLEFAQKESATPTCLEKRFLFSYTQEDMERVLIPMIAEAKEGIGSMGDTARPAFLSSEPRPFFDYFYQDFAQVTNPPLDYLREEMVTDLATYIGGRPNIFAPKELIPPRHALEFASPVLSLSEISYLRKLPYGTSITSSLGACEIPMTFSRAEGEAGFRAALNRITDTAIRAVDDGCSVLIVSDYSASPDNPPIPSLLVVSAIVNALNREGDRLEASLIVHSAEIRSTHHVASLIAFGATAVSPYLALEIARYDTHKSLAALDPDIKERNLIKALQSGLLKIMAKMGISVVRSYQGSKLFTPLGLGQELMETFFPGVRSPIGGISVESLVSQILKNSETHREGDSSKLPHTYQFQEHPRGVVGEKHSMTNARSRIIHKIVQDSGIPLSSPSLYAEYLAKGEESSPVNLRNLLIPKKADRPLALEQVQPKEDILSKFGSGAMSFGAISAESQRDIFIAMKRIGGRSNSGEGGENPYYFINGTHASIKQIASGRFGVTAEYLMASEGFQIKIAQGAKPGEGGQLMGVKVTPEIARARHATTGIDLISPPPLHDIYSIEDLKQLIYELKQFKPEAQVSVKLVAGANIGTIAVGVAKAGADVVHVAGHDGGTGAASLSSMKHAGLPWELGLAEVHRALVANGLRDHVILRVDGGLHTGRDLLTASLLGADEFEFGKLLLVAEGCVMARICEKNTCPTGIATHDPKFKAKYKGSPDAVVKILEILAEDLRHQLAMVGLSTLKEATGRADLLIPDPLHQDFTQMRGLDLRSLIEPTTWRASDHPRPLFVDPINSLNNQIVAVCEEAIAGRGSVTHEFPITTSSRAALATLSGEIARRTIFWREKERIARNNAEDTHGLQPPERAKAALTFVGSAGQGFGVFMPTGIEVTLLGEANDSVGKGMSGGVITIKPPLHSGVVPEESSIVGNCALYGATGGKLFVRGLGGDRFGVRNSGAHAVVEGVGLHACEYMTSGTVLILKHASFNIGAGMTGGTLYLPTTSAKHINKGYLAEVPLTSEDDIAIKALLEEYHERTGSPRALELAKNWANARAGFVKFLPRAAAKLLLTAPAAAA